MTNNGEDFLKALKAEADLAEALLGVVNDKQRAIVAMNGDSITAISRREQDLVGVLRKLELERARIATSFASAGNKKQPPLLNEILAHLDEKNASFVRREIARLRTSAEKITAVNTNNRMLLQHSLRFVQETMKMVTDDNRRKIVDARI